jgi:hypothetical protein
MMAKKAKKGKKKNEFASKVFIESLVKKHVKIEQDVKEMVAGACISGFEEIVYGTPVKTGYAASEWLVLKAGATGRPRHDAQTKQNLRTGELAGIIATGRVESLATGLSTKAKPNDYFEKIGSATVGTRGNFLKPSDAVKAGAHTIMWWMKVGRPEAPSNFNFINYAPYIGILENTSYSGQGQGFIKRGTMKIKAILEAERKVGGKKTGLGRTVKTKFGSNKQVTVKTVKAWLTGWMK